jgi:enoyl-CoA hydratase/carnithine racemase
MEMEDSPVTYSVSAEGVAVIKLNRPKKLNAFDGGMFQHLSDNFDRFDQDQAAKVAVLAGEGRAFSAGADVNEPITGSDDAGPIQQRESLQRQDQLQRRLFASRLRKPVVAAVHGFVIGNALEIVFQCELVVAAAATKFRVAETIHGFSTGAIWPLFHFRGGAAVANYAAITGSTFEAADAYRWNLVNEVVPAGEHLTRAIAIAEGIAELPQESVRQTVRLARWYAQEEMRQSTPFFELSGHLARRDPAVQASRVEG